MRVCVCACVSSSTNQPASCQSLCGRVCLYESVLSLCLSLLSVRQNNKRKKERKKKTQLSSWPFCSGHQTQSIIMKLNGSLRSVLTEGWLLLIGGRYEFRSSWVFPVDPPPHPPRQPPLAPPPPEPALPDKRSRTIWAPDQTKQAFLLNTCTR